VIAGLLLLAATAAPSGQTQAAFARNLEIRQPVAGRVVAVLSDVAIDARVSGDVVVWGGSVSFGPSGFVEGNLSVFGGGVSSPPGAPLPVRGTVSTPGALLRLYLDEMHRPPWEEGRLPLLSRGMRLIALSAWLIVSLALLFFFTSALSRAASSAAGDWPRTLLAGALGVLSLLLAAASVLALLPAPLSVPIAILCGVLAVAAKVFGMAALFLLVGQRIFRSVAPAARPVALAAGLALLGAVSLVPLVGPVVWSAASVVAVGIAFLSRFGTPHLRVAISA
jgi:hypothetical protein